jgi:hypothetical protein
LQIFFLKLSSKDDSQLPFAGKKVEGDLMTGKFDGCQTLIIQIEKLWKWGLTIEAGAT